MNENEYQEIDENFDIDDLETALQNHLDAKMEELQVITENEKKIGSPDALGDVIMESVWDQFIIQIGAVAGEDFVKENRGLKLNLSKDAHIQTTENFAQGKIADHNTEIDYQQRYNDWQKNFQHDADGKVITHNNRLGNQEATLVEGARNPFDKGRPTGSVERGTNMDHTVSAGEIIRDPGANAHMTKEQQIAFANSEANLNEMNASWNKSKGDLPTNDWLDTPNSKGQKPREIFDGLDEKAEKQLRQKDAEARQELDKQKQEAEQCSIEAGEKSRKNETIRAGKAGLRAFLLSLLASLVKEIIQQLIAWFKSGEKKFSTFIDKMKAAFINCFGKLSTYLQAAKDFFITILNAIWGPVVSVIVKVGSCIKQGWQSLKDAIKYIKDPKNKNKDFGILVLEVGKIITAGVSATMSIVLGELITKGLESIGLGIQIPLLGSLASIIGMFGGALVSGVIGAITINYIQKLIAKKQKAIVRGQKIDAINTILEIQKGINVVKEEKLNRTAQQVADSMTQRHSEAESVIQNVNEVIFNSKIVAGKTANSDELNSIEKSSSISELVVKPSVNKKSIDELDNLLKN